jgi:predicted  nucleic acid-binding Zn-ribbon protein
VDDQDNNLEYVNKRHTFTLSMLDRMLSMLERVFARQNHFINRLDEIERNLEKKIMATLQEVRDDLAQQYNGISGKLDNISDGIDALKKKLADGGTIEAADLDALKSDIDTQSLALSQKADTILANANGDTTIPGNAGNTSRPVPSTNDQVAADKSSNR